MTQDQGLSSLLGRFWARVEFDTNGGCWLWSGATRSKTGKQRPAFCTPDGTEAAYRAAYKLFRGAVPPGLFVCHSCDVPMCVNPGHLFIGTHQDNMADMVAKGRWRMRRDPEKIRAAGKLLKAAFTHRGTSYRTAKLNDDAVRAIRASAEAVSVLMDRYGVSETIVRRVRNRTRWTHVTD